MNSSAWILSAALSVSTLALAQDAGVTETTDPAKIAAIEQHAQALASRPSAMATGEGGQVSQHGMRHHKSKAMHSDKAHHPRAKKDKAGKPASDMPMATDSKS